MSIATSNLGYPRIGENREWKKLLESFWAGKLEQNEFIKSMKELRLTNLRKQQEKGIEIIPVGDFTLYDHMLDHSAMFGLVPARYEAKGHNKVDLETYYAMARGNNQAPACEMTKWFNTNYHYIVPELNHSQPHLTENHPLHAYREAKQELGIEGKPVIVGPYTFLKLAKGYASDQFATLLSQFALIYCQILKELEHEGVHWIQIDEPALAANVSVDEVQLLQKIYRQMHQAAPTIHILLQTYFDTIEYYRDIVNLPVQGIGLDFVHGKEGNLAAMQKHGFPDDKWLAAGIIDGRNIWRANAVDKLKLISEISDIVPLERLIIQPSCSLLHVPVSLKKETNLEDSLKQSLSYADEKLDEVISISLTFHSFNEASKQQENAAEIKMLDHASIGNHQTVNDQYSHVNNPDTYSHKSAQMTKRHLPFDERRTIQELKWQLPPFPTTTIGSFPQTQDVRQARQRWRKGELSESQYSSYIKEQIKLWIEIQEQIGLDVLVHGEFERTDMVEFFGEKLGGFAFTQNGWVQSYGSRCVKPPVIYGDVSFRSPMTVEETVYAQSLTAKPVKGMLTGPITILNWSFVRDDISRQEVAYQIAAALRQEIEALEASGIEMIQVDEPALREGLPLKRSQWDGYLSWAVEAFRIATSTVKDTTQIHTHMCYCEFHDIIDSIRDLDADVISIETSRSHGELIDSFETNTYGKGIGLGVYDIHSPRVPDVEEMLTSIRRALRVLPGHLFWINPDCGLKTRGTQETIAALNNMVAAAHEARKQWNSVNYS